jgi:shikimate kinase
MPPVVVLVGAPGAGKSTVGALLAQRLGVGFRDTDADIEASVGKPISDQFVDDGEAVFRDREVAAVAEAVAEHEGVLALGGGAVTRPETRALLADQPVCWLVVSATEAGSRVGLGAGRPMLLGSVRSRLVGLLQERTPLYQEVADLEVDTSGRDAEQVADEIAGWLAGRRGDTP